MDSTVNAPETLCGRETAMFKQGSHESLLMDSGLHQSLSREPIDFFRSIKMSVIFYLVMHTEHENRTYVISHYDRTICSFFVSGWSLNLS